ncbi:hypothetical protein AYJ54_16140 [Bradyrhizobium centrolobii]|uniref:DUF4279 domain-containing protein n=1 Tax=Bradyrhizobium centrolobii TaxID=1505087 RepID=A0A176YPK4_9BRAD|nr:hypothetical protein [Bradyrhizobium centrolobii]OAF08256.1 hypothetical protein AYJ54_16140 [Bradyrhizobium centrolobii]
MNVDRYADLWLTDFPIDPDEVVRAFPIPAFLVARKGEPTGLGQRAAMRNVVIFRNGFTRASCWTEAIEALISALGGWEEVGRVLNQLTGADRLVRLTLPVSNSPHQENDFVEAATLAKLARLDIDLGIEFTQYATVETD